MLDPLLTVLLLAQKLGAADATGDAVVPARYEWVDKMHACHRHGGYSPPGSTQITTGCVRRGFPEVVSGYFSTGIDTVYHGDPKRVKTTSPVLERSVLERP
jgi:hypothetical protein